MSEAPEILEVSGLSVDYVLTAGRRPGGRRRVVHGQPGRVPRHRRRIGLREVHAAVRRRPAARPAGPPRRGHRQVRGDEPGRPDRQAAVRHPLARHVGGHAERDERAEPGQVDRRAVQRRAAGARQAVQGGDRHPVGRGAADGRHRPGAPEELPAPAVRRHAAALDDRDGDAVHPGPDHHGRADVRARRGGAALADGADQGAPADVWLRGHLRHPRHVPDQPLLRPAHGDVRRPDRRAGRHQDDLRPAAAPVHPGPAGSLPVHPRPACPAQGNPGQPS